MTPHGGGSSSSYDPIPAILPESRHSGFLSEEEMTLRYHIEKTIAILAVVAVGTGCSTCNFKEKDAGTLNVDQRPLSLSEALTKSERDEAAGWSEYAKGLLLLKENPAKAQEHFVKALTLLPDSMKALGAAVSPLIQAKEIDKAIELLRPIAESNLKSFHINMLYANLLAEREQFSKAIEHLEKCLEATDYSELKMASSYAGYLVVENRFNDAEDVFRRFEKNAKYAGSLELLSEQAVYWHTMMNFARDAKDGVAGNKRKVTLPKNYTVDYCEQKARGYVGAMRGCKPATIKELAIAGDLFSTFERWDLMWEMLEGIKDKELRDTIAFISMRLDALNKLGNKKAYREYALSFLKEEHLVPNFSLKLVQCFQDMKDYDSAILLVQRLLASRPDNADLRRRLALLYVFDKQFDTAIQIFNSMLERSAHDEYMLALIWRDKGDFNKAYECILTAEKKAKGDKDFLDREFYFSIAMICEKCGKIDEAIQRSKQAYELDKENASACNFYGYVLADYNKELPFAKELIAKAVEAEPDNVAYLDSMAWVYFRLKEFKPALDYILKAFACGGMDEDSDGTIAKHAADICRENGLEELARHYSSIAKVSE